MRCRPFSAEGAAAIPTAAVRSRPQCPGASTSPLPLSLQERGSPRRMPPAGAGLHLAPSLHLLGRWGRTGLERACILYSLN